MNNREAKRELIRIASGLLRSSAMSTYREDWPKQLRWAEVRRRAEEAHELASLRAQQLRTIADAMEVK